MTYINISEGPLHRITLQSRPGTISPSVDRDIVRETSQRRWAILKAEEHIDAITVVEALGFPFNVSLTRPVGVRIPVALPLIFIRLLAPADHLHFVGSISQISEVLGEEGGIEKQSVVN